MRSIRSVEPVYQRSSEPKRDCLASLAGGQPFDPDAFARIPATRRGQLRGRRSPETERGFESLRARQVSGSIAILALGASWLLARPLVPGIESRHGRIRH